MQALATPQSKRLGSTTLQYAGVPVVVTAARQLLESTDDPPGRIAESCGLGTEANLRHHFAKLVGVAPTEYRREFRRPAA
jgi:transcriptional regulator GlxA family with amidase domain